MRQKALVPIFLLVPAGLYFLVAMTSHLNLAFATCCHLPVPLCSGRRPDSGIGSLAADHPDRCLAGHGGSVAVSGQIVFFPARGLQWQTVAPHYLAYFNELAGGPANGFKELADSNLDWGQDLRT